MTSLLVSYVSRMRGTAFLSLLILCALQPPSAAQTINSPTTAPETRPSTVRQGFPGRRFSSGSRCPDCIDSAELGPVLLLPTNYLVLTEESAPTLLFHLPAMQNELSVQLSIIGPYSEVVYLTEVTKVNEIAGIVRMDLSLLDEPPVLDSRSLYSWYLSIVCDPDNQSKSLTSYGMFGLIDSTTLLSIEEAGASTDLSSMHNVEDLILSFNWYRELTALDLQRRQVSDRQSDQGQAIEAEWRSLLTAAGLDQLADAPPIEFTFDSDAD